MRILMQILFVSYTDIQYEIVVNKVIFEIQRMYPEPYLNRNTGTILNIVANDITFKL